MNYADFYVIVYDIVNDRRRLKVAKLLEQVGERVQDSVFEAWLLPSDLHKLVRRLERQVEPEEDSIRIYALCAVCREKKRDIGQSVVVAPPGVRIV
jgi:CRISPR-associated protein Cas2